MASPAPQLDQLISTTLDNWRTNLIDQTVKKSSVYAALESKSKVVEQGGNLIKQPLMYALNDTVKFFSGYDLFDTTPQGGLANVEYPWRLVAGTVTISGEERLKNSGPEAFINLLTTKFRQLEMSFIRKFNETLFATTIDAKSFNSLTEIVGATNPARGNLGGLDATTETFWQSIVETGPVVLTGQGGVKQLNNVVNRLWVNGSVPDFEFTTQANFEAYEALMIAQIRFNNESGRLGDLGFRTLAHKGQEIVFDPFVPAPGGSGGGYWYFINSEYLEFVRHSQAWMTRLDTQRPYNQFAFNTPIVSMGNLVTGMRRAHAVVTNVTV